MQEFLDNNQYNKAGILMYERVFGKGFVSPGGMTTMKVWWHALKNWSYIFILQGSSLL